jgi:hypothetical protein
LRDPSPLTENDTEMIADWRQWTRAIKSLRLRFLTDREVEVEVGDGEDGFHVSNREISGVGGANPGSLTSPYKPLG